MDASFGKRFAIPRQRRETEKIIDGAATPDSFSLQNLLAEKLIALGSKRF